MGMTDPQNQMQAKEKLTRNKASQSVQENREEEKDMDVRHGDKVTLTVRNTQNLGDLKKE